MGRHQLPLPWRLRLAVLTFAIAVGLVLIGQRLYALQMIEAPVHAERSRLNTIVVEPLSPPRGRFLDARGVPMVTNQPRYQLSLLPAELRRPEETAHRVAASLGLDETRLRLRLERHARRAPLEPLIVDRSLTAAQLAKVAILQNDLPGVYLGVYAQRRYLYGTLASHVLGHVGETSEDELRGRRGYALQDVIGKTGLDAQYDKALRGRKGSRLIHVDTLGRAVRVTDGRRPVPGQDLELTIDLRLQQRAEMTLGKALANLHATNGERVAGAAIVMEANTGRILAFASLPNYDPRPFARGIKPAEYRALLSDGMRPMVARAFQGAFPPGSTFKIVNASASLQEHVCSPGTVFYCYGSYKGANCFVTSGHGAIDFTNAIAQSCDVTFYMLGDRLGIKRLSWYAFQFGLGHRTGVDLPAEDPGLFPTEGWKKRAFGEPWYQYDIINTAIGQGYVSCTPLQMAVACATVANGGKVYRPYFVERMIDWSHRVVWQAKPKPERRVPVKPAYLVAVRRGMREAVLAGTGGAANSEIVTVAGKTGTAENVPTVDNPHGRNHAWFVSFAPYEKPEIVTVVFLEKSGGFGGSMSAPVARDLIDFYFTTIKPRKAVAPAPLGRT